MNLYDIISNLKLDKNGDRNQMYSSIKSISSYVNEDLSKMTKSELVKLIEGLEFYLKSKQEEQEEQEEQEGQDNQNMKWNFVSGQITLDSEQIKIVKSPIYQHQRIIAGAGSGKTTTILCRVKYLLDKFMCPDRILILTFNRDSAQNIRNRINDLFGFSVNLHIYTIDAFCCKLMYMYGTHDANKKKYHSNTSNIKSLSEYSNAGLEIMKAYGKEISQQFTHVFFDEFQDVNDIQFGLLKIFTIWGSWLSVIGDDCQNIYQFRGTNNYYMVNFDHVVPNSHTYKLTSNYRSTSEIVSMANTSISWNANRVEKQMKATKQNSNHEPNPKPTLVICGTDADKYSYVIKKIAKLIEFGYDYGDIAILSRNTYPLKCIEAELTKHSIPHVALITDKNSDDNKRLLEPNKLALTTIFKSKGLEWKIVILLGMSHAHWPEHMNNNIKNIEEERRLFYVGITRAKKYLYMMSSASEIPLSVFVKETLSHVAISYYHTKQKYSRKELFNGTDTEMTLKLTYGVNEIISSLQSQDYENLRKKNLILRQNPQVLTTFETKLVWLDSIKKGAFEPDFGEYVDRYITRGICVKLDLDFIDTDTEFIINQDENSIKPEEFETNKYKINTIVKKMQEQNIIRKFTFPQNVINKIKHSYQKVQDNFIQTSDVSEEIYWISLCRNFRLERTRLAWRNIYEIFKQGILNVYMPKTQSIQSTQSIQPIQQDTIKSRMEYYINKFGMESNNVPKCKIYTEHKFKNVYGNKCAILGELDILVPSWLCNQESNKNYDKNCDKNCNKWTLIDFKCSESDFRLEWMLQLLTYYSLIKLNGLEQNINIDRIGIINVMDGKEYYFDIEPDYDFISLILYWEEKICLDQQSLRPVPDLNLIIPEQILNNSNVSSANFNQNSNQNSNQIIYYSQQNISKSNFAMVLDTETTDYNGDIIQFAWTIIDLNTLSNNAHSEKSTKLTKSHIIKSFCKIVKNRIPSTKSVMVHQITLDRIRNEGVEFFEIMKEFIMDLSKVNKIIGHNIAFDLRIITNNLRKYGIVIYEENSSNTSNSFNSSNPNLMFDIFKSHEIICTRKLSGGKSLENLYNELFGKNIIGAHDALNDVNATMECWIELEYIKSKSKIIICNNDAQKLTSKQNTDLYDCIV